MCQSSDCEGQQPGTPQVRHGRFASTCCRGRWLAVAVVATTAWGAGLVAGRLWHTAIPQPESSTSYQLARLPAPNFAPDLHPDYRALLEEAEGVVRQLLRSFPQDARAVAALARLHNLAHDEQAEDTCWQRCLELDREYSQAYHRLAVRAIDRGEYQRGESLLRDVVAIDPSNAALANLLARSLMSQSRLDEAVKVLEDYIATNTASPATFLLLAQMYLQLRDDEKAHANLKKTLSLDPESTQAYVGLISVCSRLNKKAEAERYRAQFEQLQAHQDQAARKKAKEMLKDAYVVPQCTAEILAVAGKVYLTHGQIEIAEEHLMRAAELDPSNTQCREGLAGLYEQAGRLEDAVRIIEELRDLESWNVTHRRNLGILQARMNRFDEAEATFREICAVAPNQGVGYACLAELLFQSAPRLAEARDFAAMAVRLEPVAQHFFIAAAICERQGDTAAARSALERAMALEPENPRHKALREAIGKKR